MHMVRVFPEMFDKHLLEIAVQVLASTRKGRSLMFKL